MLFVQIQIKWGHAAINVASCAFAFLEEKKDIFIRYIWKTTKASKLTLRTLQLATGQTPFRTVSCIKNRCIF